MKQIGLRTLSVAMCLLVGGTAVGCSDGSFGASPSGEGEASAAGALAAAGNGHSGGPDEGTAGSTNAHAGAASGGASFGGSDGGSAIVGSPLGGSDLGGAAGASAAGAIGSGAGGVAGSGGSAMGGGGANASGGGGAAGGGCAVPWYPDSDGDRYGRSSGEVLSCDAPTQGTWVTTPGDCNDDSKLVFPTAGDYSAVGYTPPAGGVSFDYDCSGIEEEDPTQLGAALACNGLLGIGCSGSGFQPTSRSGTGVNPLCGSKTLVTCKTSGLSCIAVVTLVADGVRCH